MDYILALLYMICREDVKSGRNWEVFLSLFLVYWKIEVLHTKIRLLKDKRKDASRERK